MTTFKIGENINEVIDKMIDAIRNPEPEVRYESIPGSFFVKSVMFLMQVMPSEINDFLMNWDNNKQMKLLDEEKILMKM